MDKQNYLKSDDQRRSTQDHPQPLNLRSSAERQIRHVMPDFRFRTRRHDSQMSPLFNSLQRAHNFQRGQYSSASARLGVDSQKSHSWAFENAALSLDHDVDRYSRTHVTDSGFGHGGANVTYRNQNRLKERNNEKVRQRSLINEQENGPETKYEKESHQSVLRNKPDLKSHLYLQPNNALQPITGPGIQGISSQLPKNKDELSAFRKLIRERAIQDQLLQDDGDDTALRELAIHSIRGRRRLLQKIKVNLQTRQEIEDIGVDPNYFDVSPDIEDKLRKPSLHALSRQLSALYRSQLLSTPRVPLRGCKKWKYERAQEWKRTKRNMRQFFDNFNIWQSSFKTIEGNFGSSVVSYFQFLKWLFLLNIFTMLCILAVIVLPQALMAPKTFNNTLYGNNSNGELTSYQEEAAYCSANYSATVRLNTESDVGSRIIDIFQGTGYMENTYLFIGFYFNKTEFYGREMRYNMPLGYILVTGAYLFVTLVFMVRYTAHGVKEKLISQGNKFYQASCMVFTGWDYTISSAKAVTYKHLLLYQEMSSEIQKQKLEDDWRAMATMRRCRIYFLRVLINIITLAILAGAAALIYFVVEIWKPELLERPTVYNSNFLTLVVEFLPSGAITVLNIGIPILFQKIVLLEHYMPEVELKITIVRTVFVRLASLVVLAVTLLRVITCSEEERFCGNCDKINCWETFVGQELYKLVILEFFVFIASTFLVEFPRRVIVTRVKKLAMFHQEFDIIVNVLNIVYTQTLSWWGAFYCPLIPGISVIKLFVLFYCKKVSLLNNQLPPSRPYRAARSNHFFMVILMISFTLSTLAIAYSIGKIHPSQGCSPFRIYSHPDFMIFHSLTNAINTLPTILQELFHFIASWIFYLIAIVILVLCIYYFTARSAGSKKVTKLLMEQLALVETDKQFLLKRVNEALQQNGYTQ